MANPVPHVTREMINSYPQSVAGGTTVDDLFIRDVDDFIPLMKDTDAKFIRNITASGTVNKLKYEFGEGDLPPREVKVTTAVTDGTETTIEVDHPEYIQQYDVLWVPETDEQMRVTDRPDSTVTVTRGHGGSTADAIAVGTEIKILGPAVPEGADTPDSPSSQGNLDYNYPQIFEYSWSITHRGKVTPTYEIKSDRFKWELKRKMKEAALDLNRTAIFGLRSPGDGTATNPSTTGGARQFAKANRVELTGEPLELSHFLNALEMQYKDVGLSEMSKTFYGNVRSKRILNSFLNPLRRATTTDAKLNLTMDTIDTDFGEIKFVIDEEFPDGELYSFNFKDIKRTTYEGGSWKTGMFSTYGWYDRGFLRGDFGFVWAAPRRRCAIVGFSSNPADYENYDAVGLPVSFVNNVTVEGA